MFSLPKSLTVKGIEYPIRSDFRVILDVFEAFEDNCLTDMQKWLVAFQIIFIDYEMVEDFEEACNKMSWFINCGGKTSSKNQKKLYDWVQDFQYIVGPINKMLGKDIREEEYLHWWTFMGYFNEMGESVFSTIVSIRDKQQKGKKLEKYEQDFVSENPEIINLPVDNEALELLNKIRN